MKQILLIILLLFISCKSYYIKDIDMGVYNKYLKMCVIRNCELSKIDPIIVFGLIKAESNFKKYARSSSGAMGYMQLKIPAMKDGLRFSGYTNLAIEVEKNPKLLYDTDINILAGTSYLRWILEKRKPVDWMGLIAYYNSGYSDQVVGSYIIKIKRYYDKYSDEDINDAFRKMK